MVRAHEPYVYKDISDYEFNQYPKVKCDFVYSKYALLMAWNEIKYHQSV